MVDMGQLARALQDYHRELQRHTAKIHAAYAEAERALARLTASYEGTGARQFKEHWARTKRGMQAYETGTASIAHLLEQRIDELERADRPSGL